MKRIVILALLLLPIVAAAQLSYPEEAMRGRSSEYQKGFRDGFREAMRMMNEGGGGGWGSGHDRGLRIESASYGTDSRSCDLTRNLAQQADGRGEYVFLASNRWCGDPHKGREKAASIRYRCGGKSRRVHVPEGSTVRLLCD